MTSTFQLLNIEDRDRITLRFAVGDRVLVFDSEWHAGTVVALFYVHSEFPPGKCAPYQVRFDDLIMPDGSRVGCVTEDTDRAIKAPEKIDELILACELGKSEIAAQLIAANTDVNQVGCGGTGFTALFVACQMNQTILVNILLAANANVNQAEPLSGNTPLYVACEQGHTEVATKLIVANANVNQTLNDGSMPLFAACVNGHSAIVTSLLAANAKVNQPKNGDVTPLWIACFHGHTEVVTKLLAANANVDQTDTEGATPLLLACGEGHTEIAATLIAANANVNQAEPLDGETPLFIACQEGHPEVVAVLIANDASVIQPRNDGVTPLLLACQKGHTAVVAKLLAANANVNQAGPLLIACLHGRTEVVAELIANGASVNQPSGDGATPLHIACGDGHTEIAAQLIAANADVHQTTEHGSTLLWDACEHDRAEIAETLLAANANVDEPGANGTSPLCMACFFGHLRCVKILSSYGASRTIALPQRNKAAEHIATDAGHHDVAAWLVRSRHWSTALHHLEVLSPERARKLLRAGADIILTPERAFALLLAAADVDAAAEPCGPTPLALAQAALAEGKAKTGSAAFLVLEAAKPWSRRTHTLFPAAARARAVELMLIGELLSREERFAAYGPQAVVDAWMTLVVPKAVSRNRVQVVGLTGRPELNGQNATIGKLDEAKGRYPVKIEFGGELLIKMMNVISIGDDN